MLNSTITRRKLLLSAALLCLSLGAFICAAIIDRWPELFGGLIIDLIGFILWLVWVFHLGWMLLKRHPEPVKRIRFAAIFFCTILGSMILFALVLKLGSFVADKLRLHDIRMAVNAGLQENCLNLLHNWPVTNDAIDMIDTPFSKLPRSIQMLKPVDVLNERIDDTSEPPNIGVCWSSFGGFYGTRVFQNDDDAKKLETMLGSDLCSCERVAPGVYFWVEY
jgi:hypothetical protein